MRRNRYVPWISLAICAVLAVAWAASLFVRAEWVGQGAQRGVILHMGAVFVYWRDAPWDMARPGWYLFREFAPPTWTPAVVPAPPGTRLAIIPLWLPIAVLACLLLLAWRRSRRPPSDHCQWCGYNLAGNVSGRCPECGMDAGEPGPPTW